MTQILDDFSPATLERAVKSNLFDFFRFLGRAPQTAFRDEDGVARWRSPVPYSWFNGALAARPARSDDARLVAETVADFVEHGTREFTWWLSPDASLDAQDPPGASWSEILQARGFRHTEGPPGMALDLNTLRETARPELRIVPVTDAALLREWTMTFIAGYEVPPDWGPPLFDLLGGIGLDLPVRHYLGYLNDKPVATSSLFLSAGVAGILFVSTLREARGQGLGAALTLAPLLEARRMGCRIGVLQSSELGFPVYRRMGFEQVCQVEHFYWKRQEA